MLGYWNSLGVFKTKNLLYRNTYKSKWHSVPSQAGIMGAAESAPQCAAVQCTLEPVPILSCCLQMFALISYPCTCLTVVRFMC